MIEHQLPDCFVGQQSELPLEPSSHEERAQDPLERIVAGCKPAMLSNERVYADGCFSGVTRGALLFYQSGVGKRVKGRREKRG
jgi:hypothetical protein